jgi:plasmid stability protein
MQMDRKASDVKTTIWLPRRLHRAAKVHAAAHSMSVRAVIVAALDAFLNPQREETR